MANSRNVARMMPRRSSPVCLRGIQDAHTSLDTANVIRKGAVTALDITHCGGLVKPRWIYTVTACGYGRCSRLQNQ